MNEEMQRLQWMLSISIALILLVGCTNSIGEEPSSNSLEDTAVIETAVTESDESASTSELEKAGKDDANNFSTDETVATDSGYTSSENSNANVGASENEEGLSQYSSEQIEYARIWLQLGPNPEIDELNVVHISAGELINPNDETSAAYPEDVIQLAGSRLVDGSVTYSGNGDGTINIYNVPLRWEISVPEDLDENYMRTYTQEIIDNTETVYIDSGNEEEIIELIEVLNF